MQHKILRTQLLFFILMFIFPIYSQIIDPDKKIAQYTHTIYGEREGIKEVLDMTQDISGYLWMASYEGLIRYDGTKFKLFNQTNRDDFHANSVRSLSTDKEGNLWIGTNDSGISRLKDNKFTMYTTKNGLPNNSVRTIYTDSLDRIWVGTAAGLALYKNKIFETFPNFENLNTQQTLFITENRDKEIIIGTNEINGLYIYRNNQITRFTKFDDLIDGKIEFLIQDGISNDYWVITTTNLYRISSGKIIKSYSINDLHNNQQKLTLQKLYLDNNNTLWIVADGGIAKLNRGVFSFYFTDDGLSDGLVKCAFHDQEGTLWVGTRKGLDKFVEPKFTVYNEKDGLTDNAVNSILEDNNKNIWIGTNQGVSIYNRQSKKIETNTELEKLKIRIRHLYMDSKNNIWISTYGDGAVLYQDGEITKQFKTSDGLAGDKVRTIMEDSSNNIWIGTTTGLSKISNGIITSYSSTNGMPFEYVMCLYEDKNGRLWIGTDGGGILFYENGEFSSMLTKDDGLAGNVIFRIFEDSKGILWVTTGNGISRITDNEIKNYTTRNGLITNSIFQIVEDTNNNFWLTSSEGLFNVEYQDFEKGKLNLKVYNSLNGLPGGATATAWAIQDSEDDLWIPTYNGVAILNPQNISTNRIPPKIAIDNEIIIDNIKSPQYNATVLKPDTKRVTFSFASLSFQIPENVYTQYKLIGFDEDWTPLSTQREAIYTNLSHGNYSFHVRGYNNDGLVSQNDAVFNFTKQPQIYETLWFIILISVIGISILVVIIFTINNLRLRRLKVQYKRQEKELKLEKQAREAEQQARINEMKLTKSYSRFVPHQFLELLNIKNIQSVQLGHQIQKNMTIFVSDIRNFTTLSETLSPKESFDFLNSYLAKIVPIIRNRGGLIDKYMGDGIMALFPEDSIEAVSAGVEFQEALININEERNLSGLPPICAGISINTGSLMLGMLGEENRMDATVISDAVNLTFRLESLTKHYKCGMIISEQVKNLIEYKFSTRFLSTVMVKGKSTPVKIYEVLECNPHEEMMIKKSELVDYNQALDLFMKQEFKNALKLFTTLSTQSPYDELYKIYIKNCNKFISNSNDNWDGIIRL